MLKITDSNVNPGPVLVKVNFNITPLAGMPEFIVNIRGECMFHPDLASTAVEVVEWEMSIPGKPELAWSQIQSSVTLLVPTIEKDVEEAMKQLVQEKMSTPAPTTPEVTGAIDWTAVQRAFAEEFDMNRALRSAAEDVSEDSAIAEYDVSCGYGNNFTVDVSLDTDAIADNMEDGVAAAIEAWFCARVDHQHFG
jgi:hypothetical protein